VRCRLCRAHDRADQRILVSPPPRIPDAVFACRPHQQLQKSAAVDVVPVMYYSLKLLKLHLRHLGLWKRSAMPVVSAIYNVLPPTAEDAEWLATPGLATAVRDAEIAMAKVEAAGVSDEGSGGRSWLTRARGKAGGAGSAKSSQAMLVGMLQAVRNERLGITPSSSPTKTPAPSQPQYSSADALVAAVTAHNLALQPAPVPDPVWGGLVSSPSPQRPQPRHPTLVTGAGGASTPSGPVIGLAAALGDAGEQDIADGVLQGSSLAASSPQLPSFVPGAVGDGGDADSDVVVPECEWNADGLTAGNYRAWLDLVLPL